MLLKSHNNEMLRGYNQQVISFFYSSTHECKNINHYFITIFRTVFKVIIFFLEF